MDVLILSGCLTGCLYISAKTMMIHIIIAVLLLSDSFCPDLISLFNYKAMISPDLKVMLLVYCLLIADLAVVCFCNK